MRTFKRICSLLLGFVLFIAGLLKLMDPVGAGMVVESYLKFFHLGFFSPAAAVSGIFFALVETVLGAAVITGLWSAVVRWLCLGVLGLFTILTFIIWVFNPDFDCGCFGQAVHLSHFGSLVKNLVLLLIWAVAFLPLSNVFEVRKIKYVSFGITVISVILFAFYSLMSIPLVDYTSMKPGEDLVNDDGVSTLSLMDARGEYRDSLAVEGQVFAVSVFDPESVGNWGRVSALLADASSAGLETLLLVSGTAGEMESLISDASLLSRLYFVDHRTLLTFNRSNGGCVFLSDGTIIKKWSSRSYPKRNDLETVAGMDPVEAVIKANAPERLRMQGFLLYVFAVMLLL